MRTILVMVAISVFILSQSANAQAPKEVIVVDGQLAINNGPANPSSVMVENGITNPVPIFDVTPSMSPPGEEFFGTARDTASNASNREITINIPPDKVLELKYASILAGGAHSNIVPICFLDLTSSQGQVFHYFDVVVRRFVSGTTNFADVQGSDQWANLPAVETATFHCNLPREDFSDPDPTRQMQMAVSWFGYLYDAPTP